jgi:hypothetical protein
MRGTLIQFICMAGLLSSCAVRSDVKPVEMLDQRSGMTLGVLEKPVELLPSYNSVMVAHKRATFAYLGPVEWNRSGVYSYGLWVHLATGNDRKFGDIHAPGVLVLRLDDGPLALKPIETPALDQEPYHEAVPWGQTAYFDLSVDTLRRMAASHKLELDVRTAEGATAGFAPAVDTHAVLNDYVESRGIGGG